MIGSGPNSGSVDAADRLATSCAPISGPCRVSPHLAAGGRGEQLVSEADAERRHLGGDRVAQQRANGRQVRREVVVEGAHGAAHAPVRPGARSVCAGNSAPRVERANVQFEACRHEPFTQACGRVGRIDLDDQQARGGHAATIPSSPNRRGWAQSEGR